MNLHFSIYLDIVRFFAAIAVFLTHIASPPFTKGLIWWPLGSLGSEAVIVFFVLSGYVIAYVTSTREKTARQYFTARVARLYSVVLVGLVLTFVLDFAGSSFNPEFYNRLEFSFDSDLWIAYLSSVLFLNEYQVFQFDGIAPGTNVPFWSLSFEATFYVIAGLVLFFPRLVWIPVTVVILALAGKTIIALFPGWLLGALLYYLKFNVSVPRVVSVVLCLASLLLIMASPFWGKHMPSDNFGYFFPWGVGPFNRDLMNDYLVAILFAVHLIFARDILTGNRNVSSVLESLSRWAGSLTFPMYVLHYPAISFLFAVSPLTQNSWGNLLLTSGLTMLLVIAVTPVCEWLKRAMRGLLGRPRAKASM